VLTEEQDFRVYDLAATATDAHHYEAQIHARSYEVPALALDHDGRTLAYGTPDARLVLELFSVAEKRPPLIVPLRAQAESLDFGPDAKSLAVVFDERVHVLAARPSRADAAELPWTSRAASMVIVSSRMRRERPSCVSSAWKTGRMTQRHKKSRRSRNVGPSGTQQRPRCFAPRKIRRRRTTPSARR